ncbi:L-arabinose transport system permease protein AraQ [Calidithermus roseus]|uniref:L-arabinose transport system permease protein AraQ n=1 Tax=Calidithermus roseus TaxID=1644118 RepID=A0A399EVA5_9DEIN|nr:L-arabinose transport system permease protein AraQ [Calidithermus roseus]
MNPVETNPIRVRNRVVYQLTPGRIVAWVLLAVLIFITLFPLWIVIKTAITHPKELFEQATLLFPSDPTLLNFRRALGMVSLEENLAVGGVANINFLTAMRNSVLFTLTIVVSQTFFSAMAAYAFARLRFPGRDLIFFLFLAATMIPGAVLFIPNFILVKNLGWLNTFQGMVAPFVLMTPFAVFFLRQFFLAVPKELEEAAYLDGASPFYVFWRIILPISKTPLVTLAILTTINTWNEFFWPWIVSKDNNMQVLTVALKMFQSQTPQGSPDWTGLMAATFLAIIPVFILLVVLGRQVVESLQFSGLK